jgi:hypothetical protein
MLLHHGTAQAQAQAHTFRFGGEKGVEKLGLYLWGNAGAQVCH